MDNVIALLSRHILVNLICSKEDLEDDSSSFPNLSDSPIPININESDEKILFSLLQIAHYQLNRPNTRLQYADKQI